MLIKFRQLTAASLVCFFFGLFECKLPSINLVRHRAMTARINAIGVHHARITRLKSSSQDDHSSSAKTKVGPMVEDIEEVLLDQERSKGFDPLGLTKDPDQYFKLREAEIKVGFQSYAWSRFFLAFSVSRF